METGTGQLNKNSGITFGWGALLCLVFVLAVFTSSAQTQQGYVKTRGRLDSKGNPIHGRRISGVTIQVKGKNAVVTDANGSFSFPVPTKSFVVQSVKKQGYVLVDFDALAIQYTYSSNPLIFVMETPSLIAADRKANERKLSNTRALKPQTSTDSRNGKTSKERKEMKRKKRKPRDQSTHKKPNSTLWSASRSSSQKRLYLKKKSYNQLISVMADRYSLIDYDQLNEFDRRICYCILNRKLTEADSLLRSKGDIKDRIIAIHSIETAQTTDTTCIVPNWCNTDSLKDDIQKARVDIAEDCYYFYDKFILEQKYDSAAYYLELRALLDTSNLEWLNEAGCFIADHLPKNNDNALSFFDKGLKIATTQYGDQSEWAATFYYNLGVVYYNLSATLYESYNDDYYHNYFIIDNINKSMIYLLQAYIIREGLLGPDNPITKETGEKLEFVNQQNDQWKKKLNN